MSYDLGSGSGDGLAPHPICSWECIILGYGMSLPCIHLLLEPRPSQKYVKVDKEGSAMEQRGRLPASPLIMRCMENACSSCMGEPGKFLERDLAYKPIRGSTRTEDSCSMKETYRCQILGGSSEPIIIVNFEVDFFRAAFRAPGVFLCGSSRFIPIKGNQEVSKTCLIMV